MRSSLPRLSILAGVACLASPAFGQAFNLDFGSAASLSGVPSVALGAAAGQAGTWHALDCDLIGAMPWTSAGLTNISGGATGVTVTLDSGGGGAPFCLNFDEPNTLLDDQSLMDDIHYWGAASTLTINGLATGDYDIYSYAMAPDSAAFLTNVNVPSSPDPAQDVGGSFAAGYALGATHALHSVTVSGGAAVTVEFSVTVSFDSLNGMQIVPAGGGGGGSLVIACDPANNHSGGGYVHLGQSTFSGPGPLHLDAGGGVPGEFGYFLVSATLNDPGAGVSNGMLCLGAPIGRYAPAAGGTFNSVGSFDAAGNLQNLAGTSSVGSGYDVLATLPTPPGGMITSGSTWYFQCWYRDGMRSNFSNTLCATFP